LLDVRHPAFRTLKTARGKIESYWRAISLPFPEPCVRQIRVDHVQASDRQMSRFSHELSCATGAFCEAYDELKSDAARQLRSLFDPADYPANLRSLLEVTWDFPNLGTPP
jgi:hypothetical protein